ncbi:MAG: leucyl aminopeptidase [Nitrospirae bacterium]|nr:leucyl aminopeptidase [Candidatus Troglogloeales bacterium]
MEIKVASRPLLKRRGNVPCGGETLIKFSGKFLETRTDGKTIPGTLFLGLGSEKELTLDKIRQAMGKAATTIREAGGTKIAAPLLETKFPSDKGGKGGVSVSDIAQAMVEGVILALYQFNLYKTDPDLDKNEIKELTLLVTDRSKKASVLKGALHGQWIANAVNSARTLCNLPGNVLTPSRMEQEALRLRKEYPISVSVLERSDAEALGMGAYCGVARGTAEPPKFIILEYKGGKGKPIALIGKSVTFDSGGISLKPAENMEQMKYDMSGGAAVLGAMKVAAQMKLPLHIVGILPATDNMPGGKAMHPGDIVKTLSGKTVEVINTDAEGRLCLADAITYSLRYKPYAIIDLATLTGACVVALGQHAIALFGNNAKLIEAISLASEKTGEKVWPMPVWDEYYSQIKSDVADLKNTGGRPAGSITAALFLKQFVTDVPWVHLDIAGVAWNGDKPRPYTPKGSTGAGVRLLVQYLIDLAGK